MKMIENEVKTLMPHDRVIDTRDGTKATVIMVNDVCLRIRYDDSLSSNYLSPQGCSHLEEIAESSCAEAAQ
jgi:hypothetical protein